MTKIKRQIIEIDEELCNGCGECVPNCAEGSLRIVDGKARLVAENLCDGLGACLGHCPTGALRIVEREADPFDEAAVEAMLAAPGGAAGPASEPAASLPCGCPSAQVQDFGAAGACQAANRPVRLDAPRASALTHWPVQIRLVPPTAPFLKDADLLVTADCVPAAHPDFHGTLLPGKVVLLGCPKFDDAAAYVARFTEIFRTAPVRSVTVARMEVPCCGGLPAIVRKAVEAAGRPIPVREVVIGTRGEVLRAE
ncbi:4Fe-4S ferredoxin [Dissulfurirhabdus thermomarina]|uniref:4Fe-4S ferredoxin n=1 Tax=Dissulfurirhabdus thermomarina TaxID=1765737 RepID=A0A6N9TJR4_DISTH|nr:4Fe-4S dicluster domain-containing protein [Dissulfurirhabdus thermomarina]NDY41502.1 4Fe-4S ferredoxin [Dissulfurirhabdus thermomarina]NMX23871.1 4Fe-4S ferredoxin [Dissulfurirhabdus thermomarina]